MSQLGMNLPGSKRTTRPSMNIYTGLLFLGVVCLGAAVILVWMSAIQIAPEQGPMGVFKVQDARSITLPN